MELVAKVTSAIYTAAVCNVDGRLANNVCLLANYQQHSSLKLAALKLHEV